MSAVSAVPPPARSASVPWRGRCASGCFGRSAAPVAAAFRGVGGPVPSASASVPARLLDERLPSRLSVASRARAEPRPAAPRARRLASPTTSPSATRERHRDEWGNESCPLPECVDGRRLARRSGRRRACRAEERGGARCVVGQRRVRRRVDRAHAVRRDRASSPASIIFDRSSPFRADRVARAAPRAGTAARPPPSGRPFATTCVRRGGPRAPPSGRSPRSPRR